MEVKTLIIIVVACILSFFVGIFIGKFLNNKHVDGKLVIGTIEDRDRFEFIFSTDLEELQNQKQLIMEIVRTQNLQS